MKPLNLETLLEGKRILDNAELMENKAGLNCPGCKEWTPFRYLQTAGGKVLCEECMYKHLYGDE